MGSRNRDYCGIPTNPSPMRDDPDDGSREELAEYYAELRADAASLCLSCVRHYRDCPIEPIGPVLECAQYAPKEPTDE
jgi:hypothetical protein